MKFPLLNFQIGKRRAASRLRASPAVDSQNAWVGFPKRQTSGGSRLGKALMYDFDPVFLPVHVLSSSFLRLTCFLHPLQEIGGGRGLAQLVFHHGRGERGLDLVGHLGGAVGIHLLGDLAFAVFPAAADRGGDLFDAGLHRGQCSKFGGRSLRRFAAEDVGLGGGFLDAGTGGWDLIEVLELARGDLADQTGMEAGRRVGDLGGHRGGELAAADQGLALAVQLEEGALGAWLASQPSMP
jgi:hypothetical protein